MIIAKTDGAEVRFEWATSRWRYVEGYARTDGGDRLLAELNEWLPRTASGIEVDVVLDTFGPAHVTSLQYHPHRRLAAAAAIVNGEVDPAVFEHQDPDLVY